MQIGDYIKTTLTSMRSNLLRTSLTVLGVVIGITSVIIVFSAGAGIENLIVGQVQSFGGPDLIETEIKIPSNKRGSAADQQSATSMAMGVQVTSLTLKDMDDLLKLPNIKNAYAGVIGQEQIGYGNEQKRSVVMGVTASFIEIDQAEIETGSFFTDAEDKSLEKVIVLGHKMKKELFGNGEAIGKFVTIRKQKYRVIGVMKERGAVMTFDFDDMVYMPIRTLQKRVMGIDHVMYMMHQVHDTSRLKETAENMRLTLRENHDIKTVYLDQSSLVKNIGENLTDTSKDDFRVVTMVETIEIMETVTGAITLLLLAIVAVSLVVGGVGIMNIMYVAVTERTMEIGLRKAVGAKYKDIMWQFLIESIIITVAGGIIGIVLGVLISFSIYLGANHLGFNWPFIVPLKSFVVALGFSTFFGLAFGLYPARKAARLDPIKALISE